MSNYNALTKAIAGLYRDYNTAKSPATLQFAPLLGQDSENGQYQVLRNVSFHDVRDPVPLAGLDTQYRRDTIAFDAVSVALSRRVGKYIVIPDRAVASLEGANPSLDVIKSATDRILSDLYGNFVTEFKTAADAALTATSTLDLSVQTVDLFEFFKDATLEIEKNTGVAPTHLLMGPEALMAMAQVDGVFPGYAVTTGAATAQRRLGSANAERVAAYFRENFGLELIVERKPIINSSGAKAYALSDRMYLAHVAGGSADSCFKTFYQSMDRGGDLVKFGVRPAAAPDPEGVAVSADAFYKIEAVSPALGRSIPVTLPS